jgi:hypothetical protein
MLLLQGDICVCQDLLHHLCGGCLSVGIDDDVLGLNRYIAAGARSSRYRVTVSIVFRHVVKVVVAESSK